MESNLISQLQETRANLREAINQVASLEHKFLGQRPKEGSAGNPPQTESIGALLSDLRNMSGTLVKMLAVHHDAVGNFNCEQGAAVLAPRFA
jgi:hypothetical protein